MLTSAHELEASIIDAGFTKRVQERRHAHHLIAKIDEPLRGINSDVDQYFSDPAIASHVDSLRDLIIEMVNDKYPMDVGKRHLAHELLDDHEELCYDLSDTYYDSTRRSDLNHSYDSTLLSSMKSRFLDKQSRREVLDLGRNMTSLANQVLEESPCRFTDVDVYEDVDEGYETDKERGRVSSKPATVPVPVPVPVSAPVSPAITQPVSYMPSMGYPAWPVASTAVPVSTVPTVAATTTESADKCHPGCHSHCSHNDTPLTVEVTVKGDDHRF
jgi:hypothetical protein